MFIATVYIPLVYNDVLNEFELSIEKVNACAKVNDAILLLSDFNLREIKWHFKKDYIGGCWSKLCEPNKHNNTARLIYDSSPVQ